MSTPTYDPKLVIVSFGGNIVTGFVDSKFIEVDVPDFGFEGFNGAYGEGGRVKKNMKKGTCKFTLHQTSASNDVLSSLFQSDLLSLRGVQPLSITDVNGTTKFFAPEAYIMKFPNVGFGTKVENREWTIEFLEFTLTVGGNNL